MTYNLSKLEEVSYEMLVLKLQHVSSGVSDLAVPMGEAAKPVVVQSVKVSKLKEVSHEMLVWETPTCLVWRLWLRRVYGGDAKPFLVTCPCV